MAQRMGQGPPEHAGEEPLGRMGRLRDALRLAKEHPSNVGHGARTTVRVTAFHLRAYFLHQRVRCPLGEHSSIWADRRFPSTTKAVSGNPPDFPNLVAWRRFLRPGTLFVDVGANAGLYSVWAADLGAQVISIEPDVGALAALHANAALNGYEFEVVAAALFAEKGVMSFTQGLGPKNHVLRGDHASEWSGITVETTTLDEVLGDRLAHGVKIDVEGAERFVLEGGRRALSEGRLPVIQLEYNNIGRTYFGESRQPLRELLAAYGYSFLRPDDAGNLLPSNVGGGGGRDVFAVLG
jgi:FkbM family methyltransferase